MHRLHIFHSRYDLFHCLYIFGFASLSLIIVKFQSPAWSLCTQCSQ